MNLGIHPVVLTAILAGIVGLIAAIFAFCASRAIPRVILIAIALLCASPALFIYIALHRELIDARFRTYKAFYGDIHEGMTRADVFALQERRYPPNGPRQRPKTVSDEPEALGFFMNPEEEGGEPNCEGIFLSLQEGRITKKVYSPD